MKSLFEINGDIVEVLNQIDFYCQENETDEIPDFLLNELSIGESELSEKLESYFYVIEEMNGQLETVKNHMKKMTARKKAIENRIERLKSNVGQAVQMFGKENKSGNKFVAHDLFKVTASRSSRLKITDPELVPEEFKAEVVTVKIDNKRVKSAILDGEVVAGAEIDDTKINVVFR